MKKVLFVTCIPSPYRVNFFDVLGKNVELTVLFSERKENAHDRAKEWFEESQGNFRAVQLRKQVLNIKGRCLCLDVISWLKQPWDHIVLCGYSSPTVMLAMAWLRIKRIPFWLEVDGGLIRQDHPLVYRIKKLLVGSASRWFSSGEATTDYLVHYGANREAVSEYPFTSLMEKDILEAPLPHWKKKELRQELDLAEEKIILSIGQFIPRKGFDILLKAAVNLDPDAHIYIVGGEPTAEYLKLCEALGLLNVHFLGFMKKERLLKYYQAADLFVLPTREDIWGLVVNEAMAFALPVITSDRCVAGRTLVEDGVNGYIVPVEAVDALTEKMNLALSGDMAAMGAAALEKVRPYSIENMARTHVQVFENGG